MRIMAFGQCQIVHVRIEVMVALGAAVLRVCENNIAWPNPLCLICYIFAWSKHLDNLQHRFKFLCWNIGTWAQDTLKKLCIVATVSEKEGFIAFWAPAYMCCNGRYHRGYRPMLYAAIEALGFPMYRDCPILPDSSNIIPIHAVALKR